MVERRVRAVFVLTTFLLLTGSMPASAQEGSLSGTVRSADTGSPLSAVRVTVRDAGGAAVGADATGPNGSYTVEEVPAGQYTVAFELPGWELVQQPGVTIRAGETTELSVELAPRAFNLNPLTVTTSRQEQKLLDAPASVSVVEQAEIESQPALTHMDYVEGKAGIDVIRSGLQQGYVVARGFNNIFSGSMLTLTDYRIARVPSLRANIAHLDPTTTADIQRIEIVLGPGSALYGPNAAQGVLHKITKSPIDDPGSSFSVAGGLREQGPVALPLQPGQTSPGDEKGVFLGEARIAHRFSEKFGIDVSAEYFTGGDYRFFDAEEQGNEQVANACLGAFSLMNPACLTFAPTGADGQPVLPEPDRLERIANRDFDLERWTFTADAEWRPADDANVVFSYGRSQAGNSIDLTGIGAAQVEDWAYQYVQTRLNKGNLFAQGYVNWSNSGDTYILRTGNPIEDESMIAVGQLQHATELGDDQRFVYGADYIHTTPATNRTINGVHEDDDAIDEFGLYLQSETALSDRWELTLAARGDYHSVLDEVIFSPRGALVFKPADEHSVRATFNRAFATPDNNNLYLDILAQRIPIIPEAGISYALNAQGTTDRGFSFMRDQGGRPMMKSPFAPMALGGPDQFIPARTSVLWQLAVGVVAAQNPAAGALLASLPAPDESQVGTVLRRLNTGTGSFDEVQGGFSSIGDIPPIQEEITNTFELGYKGLIGERLLLSIDGYWSRIEDFIGPLKVETPNAFLDAQQVGQYLAGLGVPPAQAQQLAETMGSLPLGVVQPREVAEPGPSLMLTYRNVGDVDLFGADLSATYQVSDLWELGAATSIVEDDVFFTDDGERVELNASKFKARLSAAYRDEEAGFDARAMWRFVNGFPAASGVFVGEVPDYDVLDLTLGYEIPGFRDVALQLDVQNVLDERHRTFPGAPTLGRFTLARVRYSF